MKSTAMLKLLLAVVVCCIAGSATAKKTQLWLSALAVDRRSLWEISTNAYILVAKDRILRIVDSAPAGVRVIDLPSTQWCPVSLILMPMC